MNKYNFKNITLSLKTTNKDDKEILDYLIALKERLGQSFVATIRAALKKEIESINKQT